MHVACMIARYKGRFFNNKNSSSKRGERRPALVKVSMELYISPHMIEHDSMHRVCFCSVVSQQNCVSIGIEVAPSDI